MQLSSSPSAAAGAECCLSGWGGGVWQLKLPAAALRHGEKVKLHIVGADGSRRDRIPACIRRAVQDPVTHDYCGQLWNPPEAYVWKHEFDPASITSPRIYESHVGMGGEEPRVHTYREFAETVLPRVAKAGYNAVQLMAVQEHPYYGSFGYHVSSFFAPCSRFGTRCPPAVAGPAPHSVAAGLLDSIRDAPEHPPCGCPPARPRRPGSLALASLAALSLTAAAVIPRGHTPQPRCRQGRSASAQRCET